MIANIAYTVKAPTIIFELELSAEAMCERFISRDHGVETLDVERNTAKGKAYAVDGWKHVYVCPQSKMNLDDMEAIIVKAELKMQAKPRLVLVDYIGLMSGGAGKRYERLSSIAEGLKILAKTTNTVVIVASQIRRDPDRVEVDLHDAKDTGSIENSAQLVLGAWRPDVNSLSIRILKNTKRAGQHTIECNFDGNRQRITERINVPGDSRR
jgi:replicative DNA helicase